MNTIWFPVITTAILMLTAVSRSAPVDELDSEELNLTTSLPSVSDEGELLDVGESAAAPIPVKHRFSVRLSSSKSPRCSFPDYPSSLAAFTMTGSSNKSSSPITEVISIPETDFSCEGRPPGYYADRQISCRVFHYCNGGIESIVSFFCPACTLFDDERQLCDYWYNVQCNPPSES